METWRKRREDRERTGRKKLGRKYEWGGMEVGIRNEKRIRKGKRSI